MTTPFKTAKAMKQKLRRFFIWWRANNTSLPYWRVTYPNGERTYLLPYSEAKGLTDCFNGKMWIDYEYHLNH